MRPEELVDALLDNDTSKIKTERANNLVNKYLDEMNEWKWKQMSDEDYGRWSQKRLASTPTSKAGLKNLEKMRKLNKTNEEYGDELEEGWFSSDKKVNIDKQKKAAKKIVGKKTSSNLSKRQDMLAALNDSQSILENSYQEFFKQMIAKKGIKSINQLSPEEKKKFFSDVKTQWNKRK